MKCALALVWSRMSSYARLWRSAGRQGGEAVAGEPDRAELPRSRRAATVSELASIEEMYGRLVKRVIFSRDICFILWNMVSQADRQLCASAMLVISTAAGADLKIVEIAYHLNTLHDDSMCCGVCAAVGHACQGRPILEQVQHS